MGRIDKLIVSVLIQLFILQPSLQAMPKPRNTQPNQPVQTQMTEGKKANHAGWSRKLKSALALAAMTIAPVLIARDFAPEHLNEALIARAISKSEQPAGNIFEYTRDLTVFVKNMQRQDAAKYLLASLASLSGAAFLGIRHRKAILGGTRFGAKVLLPIGIPLYLITAQANLDWVWLLRDDKKYYSI